MEYQVLDSEPEGFAPVFEAVSCFIEVDGKCLYLLRNSDKSEGSKWGLPAGKLEDGENIDSAMVREIKEETGLKFKIDELDYVQPTYVKYPDYDFVFHLYRIKLDSKPDVTIFSDEHSDYAWFSSEELKEKNIVNGLWECVERVYFL